MERNSIIEFKRNSDGGAIVLIDGVALHPASSLKVWKHSKTGFDWGYGGSAPSQLALALMLEAGLPEDDALRCYMHFKFERIALLGWENSLTGADVLDWIEQSQSEAQARLIY